MLLAEICMIYFDFRDFENRVFDKNEQRYISEYALLEYLARNWAVYLRHARIED